MNKREDKSRKYAKQVIFKYSDYTTFFEECEVHFNGSFKIDYELEFNDCKVVFNGKIDCGNNIRFKNCEIVFGEIPKPMGGLYSWGHLPNSPDISHQRYINQEFEKKITIEFIDCDIYQEDFESINKNVNLTTSGDNIGPIIELYDGDIVLINCKIKNVVDLIESRESSIIYIEKCVFDECKGVIIAKAFSNPNGEIIIKDSLFKDIKFIERYQRPFLALFESNGKEKLIHLNGCYNMISNCRFENGSEALITTSDDGYTLIQDCEFSSSICTDETGRYPIVYTYGDVDIIDCEFNDMNKDIEKKEGELDVTNIILVQ